MRDFAVRRDGVVVAAEVEVLGLGHVAPLSLEMPEQECDRALAVDLRHHVRPRRNGQLVPSIRHAGPGSGGFDDFVR